VVVGPSGTVYQIEIQIRGFSSLLYFLLSPHSCFIFGRFAAKNRGDCHAFEPGLPEYVNVLLRPDPYLRQFPRLARQCA
jgi:hypothetical protein